MTVAEHLKTRAAELSDQVGLGVVDDDQIRFQREDALDVGIEQTAHSRKAADLGRKSIEGPDAGDAIADAHVEEHLGRRRDERDDAAWRSVGADLTVRTMQRPR